jgi:resuscitation-promoting factor RpfB
MLHRTRSLLPLLAAATLALAGCAASVDDGASSEPRTTQAQDTTVVKKDVVKHKLVRIKKAIPYSRATVKTSGLDKGVKVLDQEGRLGVRIRVVRVTLKNGEEVGRDVVKTFVARAPTAQVQLVGTRAKPEPAPASNCDDNYSGACVPVASDVDCAGGDGDGPAYADGPVRIVGSDVYDLDRDGDGVACDS